MLQPGRHGGESYTYGMNGMEQDNEVSGKGNSYTAPFWQYDSRLGRRWNVDPVVKHHESPYATFANNPIWFVDPSGADTTKKHAEIIQEASTKYSDPDGWLVAWTTSDILKWKCGTTCGGGREYIFKRKAEFTSHYRNVIKIAAKKYDIPEFLLGAIAFTEFGGDPMWIDDVAYNIRSLDRSGPDWMDKEVMTKDPNLTSFGNLSIQFRRAAEELDYDVNTLSPDETNALYNSVNNPIENIYIAAKHISTLKKGQFGNTPAIKLTKDDIIIIATRYNRGPDISTEKLKENLSYGNSIYKHEEEINNALNPAPKP
jgi:hypothetical protein